MNCVACGSEVPVGSRYCPRCGRAAAPADGPVSSTAGPSGGMGEGLPSTPPGPPTMPSPPPPPPPPAPPPPPPPPSGGYGGAPTGYAPPPGGYGQPTGYGPPPGAYSTSPSYGGGAGGPVQHGLASFGQRAGGAIIDWAIFWVASIVLGGIIGSDSATGLIWLAGIAYYVILEGGPDGQTLGKKALGIRVVRKSNGAPLEYGLALGRYFARFVDAITLGLGLLWAAWDPLHQTFHDKIVGTLVVRASVYPPPSAGGSPSTGFQSPPPSNPY